MKKLLLILLLYSSVAFANDCSGTFSSYAQAVKYVKSQSFYLTDEIDCGRSSWINSAKYYSCDGKTGFMIFTTDKNTYIHRSLPISVWKNWKNASSLGSYYNSNIKHKYQMYLIY